MTRKLLSGIFLLTAVSIGLGAFGHGSQWSRHVLPALEGVDLHTVRLLALVWYWVSGAMLTFGALLVWTWWRIGRGDTNLWFVAWLTGAFYLVEGLLGARYLGAFFLVFAVQAALLCGTALLLRGRR